MFDSLVAYKQNSAMGSSSLKTTAAILRNIIGLDAEEWRKRLGCSIWTVKSLEAGRLKLSQSLASRMASETGISEEWLLGHDLKKIPTTPSPEPQQFTREVFEDHCARRRFLEEEGVFKKEGDIYFLASLRHLESISSAARNSGVHHRMRYKLEAFIKTLEAEFGALLEFSLDPDLVSDWLHKNAENIRSYRAALRARFKEAKAGTLPPPMSKEQHAAEVERGRKINAWIKADIQRREDERDDRFRVNLEEAKAKTRPAKRKP